MEYKEAKNELSTSFKEHIDDLKNETISSYQELKNKEFQRVGFDYDIFMALAENIGYDATGKDTELNEIDDIAEKLSEFIKINKE